MATHVFHVFLSILLCLLQTGDCKIDGPTSISTTPNPPQITLTPNASDGNGGRVSIECKAPPIGSGEVVVGMSIQRVLHTNSNAGRVSLAGASTLENGGQAVVAFDALRGANVTGSTGQRTITLTLNRADCGDAGTYYCKALTQEANFNNKNYESQINVTVQVNPGPITIKPITSGTGCCKVGQTLTMTCGQFVGVDDNSSQHNWVWEYKNTNAADWQSFAVIGNPTADNTQRQPPTTDPCYKHHSSSLTRRLTLEDSKRQYRCYVNGSVTGQGVDMAKAHSVGTMQAPGNPDEVNDKNKTGVKDNQDNKDKASKASATNWLAIGLGVAGAVVCLGVGLGVALHCRRKGGGQQSMTPASPSAPPLADTETAMNTGDTAHVGQSGQDPYDAIDDNASEASTASDADTASDAASDVD